MSDSRYSYDDGSEVWPYFAVTLLGAVVVPVTLGRLFSRQAASVHAFDQHSSNKPARDVYRSKAKKRGVRTSTVLLVVGWLLLGVLGYIIVKSQSEAPASKAYDPFEILEIAASATAKEIKSAYRKLSLQFHPDKFKATEEQTLDWAEARYIDITKAYKALTDDETRENFLKYGHPDGPQQSSHGIALPSFLVNTASPFVIAAYAVFVGGLLPYLVGKWWAHQKAMTRGGLYQVTASQFFTYFLKENVMFTTSKRLIELICHTKEMQMAHPKLIPIEIRDHLEDILARKPAKSLDEEVTRMMIQVEAVKMLDKMIDIAAEFKHAVLLRRIIDLQRALIQAVPLEDLKHGSVLQFTESKAEKLSDEALKIRRQLPQLHILRARFKMAGTREYKLAPGSIPLLEIDYVIGPQGQPAPKVDLSLLDAADSSEEIDVRALSNPVYTNSLPAALASGYAPRYPLPVVPKWQVLLVNERDNKILHIPQALANVDLSNLGLTDAQLKSGDGVQTGTFKIQLLAQAPTFAGEFPFLVQILNTAYFGSDASARAAMKVVPESEFAVETVEEDDLEDEDEQKDSDEEDEDDLSDIDTDTEDEAEPEPKK